MIPGINFTYCRYFIKHYLSATRIDVLHSPFVFSLYNACIKRQKPNQEINQIEELRKLLKNDHSRITQQDFGAGSSLFSGKERSVNELVYLHSKQARISQILYFTIKHLKLKKAVELGTSLGLSTSYIGKAVGKDGKVISIEGSRAIAVKATENISSIGLKEVVTVIPGVFDEQLPEILETNPLIDFAYIDGNHRYEPTINYFEQLLKTVHNNSVLVFDDIYWSNGMAKAWAEIKQHPKVTVTVDLFFIGLIFFRKEQVKEHFKLRVW